ncbi:MAG: alpha/beta fold hydrolase [bacterium]|nr:alpha/beta fold hydrolase [bacterium]
MTVAERAIRIGASPRRLDARLAIPAGATTGAVVCHPHPEYGGTMDGSVVVAVARALAAAGVATLRFDFGGVGESEGRYDDGVAEVDDVLAAVAALGDALPADVPLAVAGYSFGALVGTRAATRAARVAHVVAIAPPASLAAWDFAGGLRAPLTIVVGDCDTYCPPDARRALEAAAGGGARTVVLAGADHFFAGREREVAAAVVATLTAG